MSLNKIIYIYNEKCSVCRALMPKVENLISEEFPKIELEILNIEKYPKKVAEYNVFAAPTLILIIEGKESLRYVRNFSIFELRNKIERYYKLLFD